MFKDAFQGVKIADAQPIDLKVMWMYLFELLGLGRLPEASQLKILNQFVQRYYRRFTLDEVRLAFDMYVQKRLDTDVQPYGQLSANFFGGVMDAYRRLANPIRQQMYQPEEKEIPKVDDMQIIEFSKNDYLSSNPRNWQKVFNANKVFDLLLALGKMDWIDAEVKKGILEEMNDAIRTNLDRANLHDRKKLTQEYKRDEYRENMARKLALSYYFEMVESGKL